MGDFLLGAVIVFLATTGAILWMFLGVEWASKALAKLLRS